MDNPKTHCIATTRCWLWLWVRRCVRPCVHCVRLVLIGVLIGILSVQPTPYSSPGFLAN